MYKRSTIGEKIKDLRNQLSISQTALADLIGVSKQTLYKYENGIITNIPSDKIELLAKYLNVSPSYLMGWEDDILESSYNSMSATVLHEVYGHFGYEPYYLLSAYEELPKDGKNDVLAYVNYLCARYGIFNKLATREEAADLYALNSGVDL